MAKELPTYVNTIKNKHSENSKAMYFAAFITKIFRIEPAEIDLEVSTQSYFLGMRGRIDALLGHLILEFKTDLRSNLYTAKKELLKYLQSYHEKFPDEDYIGMANDGLLFKVYRPSFKFSETHKKVNVIDLEEIDTLDLEKEKNPEKIYLWFDAYLFADNKVFPTSEDIKKRFGVESPTYAKFKYEISKLYEVIKNKPPVETKFKNWSQYLEVVYGNKEKELDLFLRHTYLSTLVKLIVDIKLNRRQISDQINIAEILHGRTFHSYGINNFVDEDFFTWITYLPTKYISDPILLKLLKELLVYDLEKINEDILKELYQELIEPEYRRLLGEFYTPDWLAYLTVKKVMGKKFIGSVLDPSCGSGTFLFITIRYKIKKLQSQMSKEQLLDHILNTVKGFDVHPLAVTIAKTNYLLALKDLINYKKYAIEIPVFLADSVKIPSKSADLFDSKPVFEFKADANKSFKIPVDMVKNSKTIDEILHKMYNHSQPYTRSFEYYYDSNHISKKKMLDEVKSNLAIGFKNSIKNIRDEFVQKIWIKNYQTLIELIDMERDSIWTYIIKNGYKPVFLTKNKVDFIVGNPPWITMGNMRNINYQNFLKSETEKFCLSDPQETNQYTHMELGSLFFCIVVNLYLKEKGKIGFVMPKSILVASHHKQFRKFLKPKVQIEEILDCEKITPLFKTPCCVIIGKYGNLTEYPVSCFEVNGKLDKKNVSWVEAQNSIDLIKTSYAPATLDLKPSYYKNNFYQGATIVPRNFYFIQLKKNSMMGINPQIPFVKSHEKNVTQKPWNKITVDGQLESNFLFGTLIGDDIVPFGNRSFRLVALPVLYNNKFEIISSFSKLRQMGYSYASSFFEEIENKWIENATDKSKKMSVYHRLNFRKGITRQNPKKRFKILYVASSTYLTATIVDCSEKIIYLENDLKLDLQSFIVEHKTYYLETDDEEEAHFLSAILNSKTIDNIIKPLQTRGLWGARDIHKRPLLIPIPKYSRVNSSHEELSELGKDCYKKIPNILQNSNIRVIGRLRSHIRQKLSKELIMIDKLSRKILIEEDKSVEQYF